VAALLTRQRARLLLAAALTGFLTACGSSEFAPVKGTPGYVEGFFGAIVADDPQAAIIGRDILTSDGNAVDAAVAAYFAMAVTLPSEASLGGGGICIVQAPEKKEVEVLEFLARPPSQVPPGADRPTAVPGNVRGFYALHARYGSMRWEQLLRPAEYLARFGMRVSRALAADIDKVGDAFLRDPAARSIFGTDGGSTPSVEGSVVTQVDLATVLGRIRSEGPGDFYVGPLGDQLVAAIGAAGGSVEKSDLIRFQPVWQPSIQVESNSRIAHFPPAPPVGGVIESKMLAELAERDRYEKASDTDREVLLADAAVKAFAERDRWSSTPTGGGAKARVAATATSNAAAAQPRAAAGETARAQPLAENPSAAKLIVLDRRGMAVSCAVTQNSLFGTGRIAPGTGIVLASLPGPGGRGAAMLGPMLVTDKYNRSFYFGAVASGGAAAPTSLIDVAARTLLAGQSLQNAMSAARIHADEATATAFVETGAGDGLGAVLQQRGYRIVAMRTLGDVSAILCREGVSPNVKSCDAATDPRGFGYAISAD
jgi:gamma-glutamyltranspeptidase/glutathione hydrolase